MDIETKSWNYLGTGTRVHFFLKGEALCRKSYVKSASAGDMDYCEAVQRTLGIPGVRVCPTCEKKFNDAIERLENSLQPSTGEGDYLPPAEDLNTPDDKEETVTIPLKGSLTDRQTDILNYMANGHRYQKIGTLMGLSVHQVKLEAHALIKKMGAQTAAHALATYATAQAYRNAAAQVRSGKIWAPVNEVDEHVNHVLDGIADLLKDWSDQRMPK